MNAERYLSRREVLGGGLAWAALNTLRPAAAQNRRPNIVYILADDLGWTDLGCQGSRYYETPSIDRLASQGLRLTNYHQCPNCAPTRAALLTGLYAPRTGIYTVGSLERGDAADRRMEVPVNATDLPLRFRTFADGLRAAGYVTGMFGKWHLGAGAAFHPSRRGFDEAIVTESRHFDFATDPPTPYAKGQYLADFLTDRAVDFIQRHRKGPFMLYLPHFAVHSPFQAKPELVERFRAKKPAGGHRDPVYAAMVASVDDSVGRICATLESLGIADDTVVIFSSDNGGVGGYGELGYRGITDNAPLRGGKGMLYEGGTRTPFIVRWPGVTPKGRTCQEPTIHVDLMPTLLELAGVPPSIREGQPTDGVSLVPLFRDPGRRLPRRCIYQHLPGYLEGRHPGRWRSTPGGSIIEGDWKLLEFFEDGRLELYNLRSDLRERVNLAEKMPDRVRDLHAKMLRWRAETRAAMPRPKAVSP
ncbi:MAG: sulfatase [Chthonomonadales bacterium]|nr:sulfatase [Chthonomonadales bacterium]